MTSYRHTSVFSFLHPYVGAPLDCQLLGIAEYLLLEL